MAPPIRRWLSAALAGAALVAAVTAVVALLEPGVPALGLGEFYLFAVVPIALVYGLAAAGAVSVVSMVAFSYFFLPPRYSLSPGTSERWSVLVAFLVSSLVVSQLAARSQREARRSERLADEQAALRRVATLVARGVPPPEVFAAVVREVGLLLCVDATHMGRYELDGTATGVAAWSSAGDQIPVGMRVDLEGESVAGFVLRTGRPARMHGYEHASGAGAELGRELGLDSSVGAPIVVDQRLWGVMIASSRGDGSLPPDAESRIAAFTELLGTAIANAESRAGVARLAEEQAALRRVATLVARGAPPEELFASVAEEVGRVFPFQNVGMARYESDRTMTTVAISSGLAASFPVGVRWPLGGKNVSTMVFETGRSARVDSYDDASGRLGVAMRERTLTSAVGAPIVVEGRVWGVTTLASTEQPLPADAEARLVSFTELVATAIANAESRADLAASRARIVASADEARRQIERDLHDGTQQQLVTLALELRAANAMEPPDMDELRAQLARTERGLGEALEELREISRGIHPAILSRGGLERALRALARRSAVPVELDLRAEQRLPEPVEVAAYYVVSEALTNAARHAHASVVHVELDTRDGTLRLAIRDDGIGRADLGRGSGLVGLSDRIEALGGTFEVTSPAGSGTTLLIEMPLEGHSSAVSPEP
ncbi:MAG: histidine kinase [Solirubrobacterales bacterium]|nr:histidine kinase [Solirubrobacterales bacterium]